MSTKSVGANIPNVNAWGAGLKSGLSATDAQLVKTAVATLGEFAKAAASTLDQLSKTATTGAAAPTATATGAQTDALDWGGGAKSLNDVFNLALNGAPSSPTPGDSAHPSGSLKTDPKTGVVTTPGGYKIEATGQFDWKITGPDGKETKVWGDPHVAEGDGGTWDFKRDSTFVLGDGTRINVTTKPYGNGMTVTGGLDIISGNDRVQVTDIDKGKGKTGPVTADGYANVNSFGGKDVFVMGKETDDWSFQGKEIVGSNNGGESFKLGNDLAPGTPKPTNPTTKPAPGNKFEQLADLFKALSKVFDSLKNLSDVLGRRNGQDGGVQAPGRGPWLNRRQGALEKSFSQIGRMLDTALRFQNLSSGIQTNRNHFLA
ncbi:DUF1521 domain-containing protein [Stigmatella sp. ncwal1]|uniref:DUF1521 domain-containing protein n=1 Tax=Stigmatella ashevillensis TaxID=2995309 RepID=A0ABT5DM20_9BACT|nr:DUF1521 domain-containing protein [Stigmatella ashevillena]MDC0714720.1 DUF1521 domain-containing protein [Stigmatella ashevillena]